MPSAMSYSIPIISKKDEKREIDELSNKEKEEIYYDMYGKRPTSSLKINRTDDDASADIIYHGGDGNNDGDDNATDDEEESEEQEQQEEQADGNIIIINEDEENLGDDEEEEEEAQDDDDDILEEVLDEFFDYLLSTSIPEKDKEDYMFAYGFFPHLIRDECHPKMFIRSTNYNPRQAALRMCAYWRMRVELFQGSAFDSVLSLGRNSDGALCNERDLYTMAQLSNFVRILPNDEHDRTVICLDRTDMNFKDYDDLVLAKIIWFVFHKALQKQSTQRNGVVFIIINQSLSWDFPSSNLLRLEDKMLSHCIPVQVRCRHVCVSSLVATLAVPIAKYIMPRHVRLRLQIHNSVNRPKMLNDFSTFGLHRENLPTSIGGKYNEQPSWIDECKYMLKQLKRAVKRHRSS